MTIETYTEEYFRSSNYADYLERGDRYKKTAYELVNLFQSINLIDRKSLIVDFGCAVGFLIDGFKELGFKNTVGVEISKWAREYSEIKGHLIFENAAEIISGPLPLPPTRLLTALDVFEHMTDPDISNVLETLKPQALLVRIPSSIDGGKTFALEVSRADPTHINCKTHDQWIEFFKILGYRTILQLNLFTVYSTPGVFCALVL